MKNKDILSVKNIPGLGKIKASFIIGVILLVSGIGLNVFFYLSPYGQFKSVYDSNYKSWTKGKLANRVSEMDLAFKINPSIDAIRNRDQFQLEHRTELTAQDQESFSNFKDQLNYNQKFFWFNNTVKQFPQFAFDEDEPDVAESEQFCIHLWYNPPSREKLYDKKDVNQQLDCANGPTTSKNKWNETDPRTGANFQAWTKRTLTIANCSDSVSCSLKCQQMNGRMLKDGNCVTYDILDRVCVLVDMIYSWSGSAEAMVYAGGCYGGDQVGHYIQATPDKMYKFEYVPVEVRLRQDPYVAIAQANYTIGEDTRPIMYSAYVLIAMGILSIFVGQVLYQNLKKRLGNQAKSLFK